MDLETQIKALRLFWISGVRDERLGPWKSILGDLGAASRDDAIFSGHLY